MIVSAKASEHYQIRKIAGDTAVFYALLKEPDLFEARGEENRWKYGSFRYLLYEGSADDCGPGK